MILDPHGAEDRFLTFNDQDRRYGGVKQRSDDAVLEYLHRDVPLFACPDGAVEETWYFRWWTFGKHLRPTPDGWVVTEFLPDVSWAGPHNTIACAAGHHFYEGRWLRTPDYLRDYARFWAGPGSIDYGFWYADSVRAYARVHGPELGVELLDALAAKWQQWVTGWQPASRWAVGVGRRDPGGLFWQVDTGEGMEFSIGGHGCRPTINAYQYGDALAVAHFAGLAGRDDVAETYAAEAATLRRLLHERLWDPDAEFFKNWVNDAGAQPWYDWQQYAPRIWQAGEMVDVREQYGFVPWYFDMADPGCAAAWRQLTDPEGFQAPFGPTTAERRHPHFMYEHTHDCLWNGPSWPYATSQTLVALANLLDHYEQDVMTRHDYFTTLQTYTRSHRLDVAGETIPWIDENLDPFTGEWIARARHLARDPNAEERGKDYNHSTYCDLVVTGLAGLRPRDDDMIEVNPMLPDDTWDWFCLDALPYRGKLLTILWDRTGDHYGRGAGLRLFADGQLLASRPTLGRLTA